MNGRKRGLRWRKMRILLCVLAVFLIGVTVTLYQSAHGLTCTKYEIHSEKIEHSLRVLQLTDLHNSLFGTENQQLIEMVQAQQPDIILITGDILNSGEEDTSIAISVLSALDDIAPTYVSLGNHEVDYQNNYNADISALYSETGAIVLEREYADIEINGQQLRVGGIYGYCTPLKMAQQGEGNIEDSAFLTEFQNTDLYTVLMCHMPYAWLKADSLNQWDVDCVFSGHVHGGEIILPLIGGLWAPDFGWFPGKLQGIYTSDDGQKNLVLSRGLGTTEVIPRFNNIPEVVLVDLLPE